MNAGLDFLLAALAVPLALLLSNPDGELSMPLWAIPLGGACLLAAGVPFRLSAQYWRFAGVGDLLGVAACQHRRGRDFPDVAARLRGWRRPASPFPRSSGWC